MKFPRNARIFRGQLDAAPFASVFFLLVIFVLIGKLTYTPGIQVKLPSAGNVRLPGPEGPILSVALTTNAIFFQDQEVPAADFSNQLFVAKQKISGPVTLIVQSDEDVTEKKRTYVWSIAQEVGIQNLLYATLPRVYETSPATAPKP
jgi:biopolymer transport protein ExbD